MKENPFKVGEDLLVGCGLAALACFALVIGFAIFGNHDNRVNWFGYGRCWDSRTHMELRASFIEGSSPPYSKLWTVRDLNGMEYQVTPELSGYFTCRVTQETLRAQRESKL